MDIYGYVKRDPRKVRGMLDHIKHHPNSSNRLSLFDEIKLALLTHSEMEDAIFFASLKDQHLIKTHNSADHHSTTATHK